MPPSTKVQFFFEKKNISLRDREKLKLFIQKIFRAERCKLHHLNYIFCSDKRLLEINRQFLNHDFFTDIISFELERSPSKGLTAEIYISTDRVRDNARKLGTPITQELHRVIFHGVLHFCGYGDKTLADRIEMRYQEDHYLRKYFA